MAYTKKNPMLNKGDAVYGEHFNNSALLAGMFSMVGQVNIPGQFESGLFNTTETPEKALFLRITLEKLSGTNNGNNIILDAGQSFTLNTKVVLSLFKSWKRFNITGTDVEVEIELYDENDNLIRTVGNKQELTNLNITHESIKVIITAKSPCTISNILFEVSTRKWDNNSSVTIPQEQITGLSTILDKKADKTSVDALFDLFMPVGTIRQLKSDKTPADLGWKGTWKQLKDKFLLSSGDVYKLGQNGGSATHKLTEAEMPNHGHGVSIPSSGSGNTSSNTHRHALWYFVHTVASGQYSVRGLSITASYDGYSSNPVDDNTHNHSIPSHTHTVNQSNKGSSQEHNNMPPYEVVSVWERTA